MNGKNKRAGIARVPYDELKRRLLAYMRQHPDRLYAPSQLACAAWPGHTMRAQGAAFAIGPTIRKMNGEKLLYWDYRKVAGSEFWGWRLPW